MTHIVNVTVEAFYDGQEEDCTHFFDIDLDEMATHLMKGYLVSKGMTYIDFKEMDFAFRVTVGRIVQTDVHRRADAERESAAFNGMVGRAVVIDDSLEKRLEREDNNPRRGPGETY